MTDSPSTKSSGARTVIRALALLEAVADGVQDLQTISRTTGLSTSTAYRLLHTLVQADYLRYEPRRGYHMGPKLIELGFKAHNQLHLPTLARPHLEWLASETHETVHLGILEGNEVFYLDKVDGERGLHMASTIGGRQPAYCTGLGKALLSQLPPTQWQRFIPHLKRQTPYTKVEPEAFFQELARTAQRGYSFDMEENEIGIRCVAAPIFDGTGQCVAAISIASATPFLDRQRMEALAPVVLQAAGKISRELGWPGPEPASETAS